MKDIINIIKKRSWKVYALMFGVFFSFMILSYFLSNYLLENDKQTVQQIINEIKNNESMKSIFSLISQGEYVKVFVLIFIHNAQIAIVNYFLGVTMIFPLMVEFFNGLTIGMLAGFSASEFNFIDALGFLIILFMEITATTLTAVEGMYLTYSIIRPENMWRTKSRSKSAKKTFNQSIKIILVALLILLLSAAIETILIRYQVARNLHASLVGI